MTDYDVIVVGCGPAGLMACGELAKRGVKVLGIEKKPVMGKNTRTASGYCFLNQPFNHEIIKTRQVGNKTRLEYTKCGFSVEYSGEMPGIYHSHMFTDTGKHWQASTRKMPIYNLFNPSKCQSDRYAWAAAKGAQFLPGTVVFKITQSESKVEVTARTNGKNRSFTCRKLIAWDGLSSRSARILGMNKSRNIFNYAKGPTIEYEMTGIETPYERGDMFFFGAKNFGGRAGALIMVPSPIAEDAYRLETISVLPASTGSDLIEYFIHQGPFAHWFKNAQVVDVSGAIVEMMPPMVTPYCGNVLFVGDSAAFAECLYQSATMAGYKGALCTEMELEGNGGFEEYTRFWGDHFEWVKSPKRMADYMKRVMFPRFFTVKEMDFLFELSERNPIVVDQVEATPYDFTKMIMEQFMAMPEVSDNLRKRMQEIIDADMSKVMTVVGKVQKA